MVRGDGRLPVWMITNGWREILARIFEDVAVKFNVTPDWLVNPATNRRLKLDMLYPEIGVAIRLEGLQGKQRRQRPSLEEEMQQRTRDEARLQLCQTHGIQLIPIDVVQGKPPTIFRALDVALSRASQAVADRDLRTKLKEVRATAASLARRIQEPTDLKLYAELWEDRQYQLAEPAAAPSSPSQPRVAFTQGMEVEHTSFGPGVVTSTSSSNGEILITVDFVTAGQKTLAASLVADKLMPR